MEFEQSCELLDLLLYVGDLAIVFLPGCLLLFALSHFLLGSDLLEFAVRALLAKVVSAGRVEPFSA